MTRHRFRSKADLHAHARAVNSIDVAAELRDRAFDRQQANEWAAADARDSQRDALAAMVDRELSAPYCEADLGARGNPYAGRG